MKALCKASSESEIKAYFETVYKLRESRDEFPVNFDEVWMLVYQDKHKAVKELKDKFMQDIDYKAFNQKVVRALIHNSQFIQCVDYQILAQNGENNTNDGENFKTGRPNMIYKLSLSCMEFIN